MTRNYRVAGLTIESPIPLAVEPATGFNNVDITVRRLEAARIPEGPLDGELYQLLQFPQFSTSLIRLPEGGFKLRLSGALEAHYDATGTSIDIVPDPQLDEGMLEVMLAASLLTPALNLRGWTLLHASGVIVGERLIGILGASGQGKSTVAAALVSAGAALAADDLIPFRIDHKNAVTWKCSSRLRLRAASAALAYLGDNARLKESADQRQVWTPSNQADDGPHRLSLILVPEVNDQGRSGIVRLTPTAALLEMLEHGKRGLGTVSDEWRRRDLEQLGTLAGVCPVARLELPRDRLDPQKLLSAVREAL